jgi:hypothetical protein
MVMTEYKLAQLALVGPYKEKAGITNTNPPWIGQRLSLIYEASGDHSDDHGLGLGA